MARQIFIEKPEEGSLQYCRELEAGNILFFPSIPFSFPQNEIDFLLEQKQKKRKGRKNIAYKPCVNRITSHDAEDPESAQLLLGILRGYANRAASFLGGLLAPYAVRWTVDYTSFRPFQEKGRDLRLRARNDLLHIDAFPSRPTKGARILRFFTNIHPTESRRWATSLSFTDLAEQYGGAGGVFFPQGRCESFVQKIEARARRILGWAGLKAACRPPYDQFMLRFHHYLKENEEFQAYCVKDFWEFPPNCCWAVFTDQVSHAVLSGQYALEQTFLVPIASLLSQETSPIRVLERLSGRDYTGRR